MKNKFYILIIVVLLIIIAIMGVQLGKAGKKEEPIAEENKSAASNNRSEEFISIRFNEDISKDGTVEGVEGLSWNNIMINEDEFSIRADFTIENRTENKIGAQKLKVSFYCHLNYLRMLERMHQVMRI